MDIQDLRRRVEQSCRRLLRDDRDLFARGVGERAVAGRLLVYLAPLFPGHHADIEYNRHGVDVKRVNWQSECREARRPLIVPDLVIHRRGDDDANLLVGEIKKANARREDIDCDREKLAAIRAEYRYEHSLLLLVPGSRRVPPSIICEWDGVEVAEIGSVP